nr:auxin transport protein BIG [Tanacetum cinerariifolium]
MLWHHVKTETEIVFSGEAQQGVDSPYFVFRSVGRNVGMLVPGHAVGKVMGKGRANVDNISKISGASVEIYDNKSSRGDRVAVISRKPEQKLRGKEAKIINKECMSYHFTTHDSMIVEGLLFLEMIQESRWRWNLLNLLMSFLSATLSASENAAEYFELLFKMIETEDARLFLTVRGCLITICKLITQDVSSVESLERSPCIDISRGFILHKLTELLGKFLDIPNNKSRFMREQMLSKVLEALIVIRGFIVQKTKLISDSSQLLKDLLDSL